MKYTTNTDNALLSSSSSGNSSSSSSNVALNEVQQQQHQQQVNSPIQQGEQEREQHISSSTTTSTASSGSGATTSTTTATTTTASNSALFCEQVGTVTNLFEKWNDCERTVVMYALLKRLRYPSLKFLQYSIDNNLTQNLGSSQSNLSSVVIDINANNPAYLQNLLNAYKTFQPCDVLDAMSSSSSDKDSMPCYGSDFQITTTAQCDERKLYARKEDILNEVLNMLPLLKPGNEEAKSNYLTLIPVAVKDTMQQIVPTELVQQIFSYLLIHPAISSEDRRSLNVWLRHLEDHIQAAAAGITNRSYFLQPSPHLSADHLVSSGNSQHSAGTMSTSGSSTASSSAASSSAASCSSVASSSLGNLAPHTCSSNSNSSQTSSSHTPRGNDWQTIAPPSKQHKIGDWRSSGGGSGSGSINPLCDNLNGITLNELASSQNSLGLSLDSSSLVNGVVAGATGSGASLFGNGNSSIIAILGGGVAGGSDDHDTSFSKNGTEILDFEPDCDKCVGVSLGDASTSGNIGSNLCQQHAHSQQQQQQQMLQPPSTSQVSQQLPYASILMGYDQIGDINRWSLDSKIAALKTRRSNSLTTQTISSSSSSSNSSVITVNDNCSNSTENLAQFANKPRSFSLSIEHQRGGLTNSGSDTRLDEFKPSYIKFQTRNVGMSGIGLWLKSLRLHKYIELFKNMTYEEMLHISEEFLQSVGVTKGASHKLALCIEKLKDRPHILNKLEQELHKGTMKIGTAVEELTSIVLTPMKPLEAVAPSEENIALRFLKVIDLVSNALQQDPYCTQDDETLGVFMWILDRSIHNEAFVNHANQLKELKFKLSKLKMSMVPKLHHVKAAPSNGSTINKPRWSGKTRKCDTKNGSNDRINHRKNSNDMLNFSLSCLPHPLAPPPHHQQQQQSPYGNDYNGYGSHSHQPQYKSSSYPSFMNNPQSMKHHQPPPSTAQQQQQQQQQMQQMLQQHAHFPALPQQTPQQQQPPQPHHRRSLNNLIVVAGGPQQPQQLIFKPGQGVLTTTSNDNLHLDGASVSRNQQQQHQQRKQSLNGLTSNVSLNSNSSGSSNNNNSSSSANGVEPKKTMAAVVMENLAKFDQHFTLF
ncbi:protein Smaug isoform X1 [Scaptodrosophila lebanonensis]|uniref:Protein Smaug n=1 Tax=Drosophila lebanonensis TaxID=7225 RepID=A0A6J2TEE8_DROLE|nr:protein Smaug isoform X1 [Scaptodrosophila lebanonensis]XP_030373368.1 protein Smaug isoform X1 [Scaptodrosophila lebanonensis]